MGRRLPVRHTADRLGGFGAGRVGSLLAGAVVAAAVVAAAMLVAGCAADDPRRAEAAEQLVAPPEWTEEVRRSFRADVLCIGAGCTSFRVEWSSDEPLGRQDLLSAAAGAGWTGSDIDGQCPAPEPDGEPGPYCTLTARSDEVHLTLWASHEPRKEPPWRVTLLAE